MRKTQKFVGLKKLRIERSMTQQQMAEKSGLIQQAISDYERGERMPSLIAAQKIAQALGVTVDDIVVAIQEQKAV